jgi:hypothetical protein
MVKEGLVGRGRVEVKVMILDRQDEIVITLMK